MSEIQSYVLLRVGTDGNPYIVHGAEKMKDARYWLQYIAQPGDAIFMTAAHEKYQGDGKPKYQAHLASRGKIEYNEDLWRKQVSPEGNIDVPAELPRASA